MKHSNAQEQKTQLALTIVEIATKERKNFRYRHVTDADYVLNSLIGEFKNRYVFGSKEYKKNLEQYKKGMISWEALKFVSNTIFREELTACNQKKVDLFFGIKRK